VTRPLRRRLRALTFTALIVIVALSAPEGISSAQPARSILVLISVDGWRWDYLERFAPPTMTRLARAGVTADALIPVFPSKTFPNHYTIVTGLYPGQHGIVSNNMVDSALPGRFTLEDWDVQQDTRWWGGEPLWVTAERQGQVAGTMFWPGSDVEIARDRPTFFEVYNHQLANQARVDLVLLWLGQADAVRPTFLTLYFSDVDTAGHDFGPDAEETRKAALSVDGMIGRLVAGIERLGLAPLVNYVLVSDHGMAALSRERTIVLDDYVDMSTVDLIDSSPIVGMTPRAGITADAVYAALKDKHPALSVYRRETLPEYFRLRNHPRLPDIIAIADDGWHTTTRRRLEEDVRRGDFPRGTHGYDPKHRSMHGLFVASGPLFRSGLKVPAIENVHLYEMLCRVLGLKPAPNDGDPAVTAGFFNK
jgi:predicted AlkP superfamily pyrophosphatase or phosphodiesterase